MKPKILFKTKGGHKEGMGDVVSSFSIAEEFRSHSYEVFFIVNNNHCVTDMVSKRNFDYIIAETLGEIEAYLKGKRVDIAILNQLDTPENEALIFKRHSEIMVTIEDTGKAARLADLRFNVLYPIADSFSESMYIPLSPLFQQKHILPKIIKKKAETLLLTQGGSDTHGFMPKIIKSLYPIPSDIKINVVIGPNFCLGDKLDAVLSDAPRKFDIIRGRDDLSDLMMEADLAVTGGGNTLFELACLGVPVVVVCGELFEVGTAEILKKQGFGINLGYGGDMGDEEIFIAVNELIQDFKLRLYMSNRGKQIVDGKGVEKVAGIIKSNYLLNHNG